MNKTLLGLIVLLASSRAHAMGTYITLDVVAWNSDGSAALVSRDESSSGMAGSSHGLILVSATDTPVMFMAQDSLDPDKANEKVTPAVCKKTGEALAKALAAKKFTGVTVKAGACDATISADAAKAAKDSHVSAPKAGSPAEAAVKLAGNGGTAAMTSGKLVIVLSGKNGDESSPAHAIPLVPAAKGSFTKQGDLRDVQ